MGYYRGIKTIKWIHMYLHEKFCKTYCKVKSLWKSENRMMLFRIQMDINKTKYFHR